MVQPLCKTVLQFLKSLNRELPHDPGNPLLGIYSVEMKTNVHIKTVHKYSIAALFIIGKKVETTHMSIN